MNKKPQWVRILDYLRAFGTITALEAIRDEGIYRLSARIYDLRRKGYNIFTEMISVKNRYGDFTEIARYRLEE